MLGSNLNGVKYDYDTPYFPQYRPARMREMYINGRWYRKRMELGPWTRGVPMVTIQGDHWSMWSFADHTGMHLIAHTSREINAPRHPNGRSVI